MISTHAPVRDDPTIDLDQPRAVRPVVEISRDEGPRAADHGTERALIAMAHVGKHPAPVLDGRVEIRHGRRSDSHACRLAPAHLGSAE
jgi:hypothetical protein